MVAVGDWPLHSAAKPKTMNAVRFKKELHLEQVRQWGLHYGFSVPDWFLPKVGWIVPGVIVAFLYKTDSGVAYADAAIGNPNCSREERAAGMAAVMAKGVAYTDRSKTIKLVSATSKWPMIVQSVLESGFVQKSAADHVVMSYTPNG